MENVRVRRAGYAFRQGYTQFLTRYKMLAPATWPVWPGAPGDGVQALLDALQVPEEDYAPGRSKIFIRNPSTVRSYSVLRPGYVQKIARLKTGRAL